MCVLIFSTTIFWKISDSKKHFAKYDRKYVSVFIQIACYSRQIWMKLEFQISSNLMKIYVVGGELFYANRQTDRQTGKQ